MVATDFSPAASNAVKYAADMALSINVNLFLLHVYQVSVVYSEIPVALNEEAERQEVEQAIIQLKEEMIRRTDSKINITSEVRLGAFFQELKTICDYIKPYTVVMGSQGTTAAERLLFGGHTVNAMKNLSWPLITVSGDLKFSGIKNIGFACDFENVADSTPVEEIKTLVHDFNAELQLLTIVNKSVYNPGIVFESGLMQEMLKDIKHTYHFISNENIEEGIIEFTEKNNIDLLIVLPKRHSLLDEIIGKSYTKQLVLNSHVPVMALHSQL